MATPSYTSTSGTVRKWKDSTANTGAVVTVNGKQALNTAQAADTEALIAALEKTLPVTPTPTPTPTGVELLAAPLGPPVPSQGWEVAFGDTFTNGKVDTDYWVPQRGNMTEVNQNMPGDNPVSSTTNGNNEYFNGSQVVVDDTGLNLLCDYDASLGGGYYYKSGYMQSTPNNSGGNANNGNMAPKGFALQMDEETMWAFSIVWTLPPTSPNSGNDWNFWLTDPPWTIEIDLVEVWGWGNNSPFYSFTPATWIYNTSGRSMNQQAYYSNSGPAMPAALYDGKEHTWSWLFNPDTKRVQPYIDGAALGNGIAYPSSFSTTAWMHMIIESATRVNHTVTESRKVNVRQVGAYYRKGDPAKIMGGGLTAGTVVASS